MTHSTFNASKYVLMCVAVLAALLCSAASHAKDPAWLALRQAQSVNPTMLNLTLAKLHPLQSPQALAATASMVVEACEPTPCRPVWRLSGNFTSQSIQEFNRALALYTQPPRLIVLDSTGGNVASALSLARYIQEKGIDTSVEDAGTCLSACVYVLSAGKHRTLGKWSLVGVHQQNNTLYTVPGDIQATGQDAITAHLDAQAQVSHADMINRIDQATNDVLRVNGEWLMLLVRSGVSPVLMAYASKGRHTVLNSNMVLIHHACAQALRLDTQASETPWQLDDILAQCEPKSNSPVVAPAAQ
jgi:hypothetical protein